MRTPAALLRRSTLALLLVLAPAVASAGPARVRPEKAARTARALPPVARTPLARSVRRSDARIEKNRQKYLRRAARRGDQPTAKKVAREARLSARAREVGARLRENPDHRPILVILEGPDGAGKSGTIRRLEEVFDGLGSIRTVHFGAPPANEGADWLAHYRKELPRPGEVVIFDRSYYGRVVYDPYFDIVGKKDVKARYDQIEALEKTLSKDVRIVKIYLDARGDRLAQTVGKREAIAPEKLADTDYSAFRDRKEIRGLFKRARNHTDGARPWHVVKMKDRAEGRAEILDILEKELSKRAEP